MLHDFPSYLRGSGPFAILTLGQYAADMATHVAIGKEPRVPMGDDGFDPRRIYLYVVKKERAVQSRELVAQPVHVSFHLLKFAS